MQKKTSPQEFQKSLPYDIFTDNEAYHIVFNLPEHSSAPIDCFLNQSERKLIIVSDQSHSDSEIRVPCIFRAPLDANLNAVRIQTVKAIHMISIPRFQKTSLQKKLTEPVASNSPATA